MAQESCHHQASLHADERLQSHAPATLLALFKQHIAAPSSPARGRLLLLEKS